MANCSDSGGEVVEQLAQLILKYNEFSLSEVDSCDFLNTLVQFLT